MWREALKIIGRWLPSHGRFFVRQPPTHHSQLGDYGESYSARLLRKQGYRLLDRGHRQRRGEIDLIALDGNCLVFVEVKTRSSDQQADPAEAVDLRKQQRLTRAALIYMKRRRLLQQPARFDVISIVWPVGQPEPTKVRHFKSAFEAHGHGQLFS